MRLHLDGILPVRAKDATSENLHRAGEKMGEAWTGAEQNTYQ